MKTKITSSILLIISILFIYNLHLNLRGKVHLESGEYEEAYYMWNKCLLRSNFNQNAYRNAELYIKGCKEFGVGHYNKAWEYFVRIDHPFFEKIITERKIEIIIINRGKSLHGLFASDFDPSDLILQNSNLPK